MLAEGLILLSSKMNMSWDSRVVLIDMSIPLIVVIVMQCIHKCHIIHIQYINLYYQ